MCKGSPKVGKGPSLRGKLHLHSASREGVTIKLETTTGIYYYFHSQTPTSTSPRNYIPRNFHKKEKKKKNL